MRHKGVMCCGLCGVKLAIIAQNEASAIQSGKCMTLEISP